MANSSVITDLKQAVMKEIMSDEALFYAIDNPDVTDFECADELMYTSIFSFHQNPETITKVSTFLTIQVQIPKIFDRNKKWVVPTLEIWIISHQDHMRIDNIPGVSDNRNDYIAKLLDLKFNGRSTLGDNQNDEHNLHLYGTLDLTSSTEGAFLKDFVYRRLTFEAKDINNSLCGSDERY